MTEPAERAELAVVIERWRRAELSAEVAVMELLCATENVDRALAAAASTPLAALIVEHRAGCERICAMLASGLDLGTTAATVEQGLAEVRRLFDWSVEQDAESSVAMYSLGSPEILARATDEVVALLHRWGLLQPEVRALEIGCGTGRLLPPIAARVRQVVGIDLSSRMVAAARARCADLPRIRVDDTTGRDLGAFDDGSFELAYAVDSFPYVIQAGPALVRTYFAEIHRVLVPGGHFALLAYSYRDDDPADRAEVAAMAAASGLELEIAGERPFTLWSALAFRMRR